jgi:phosphoketolase
MLSPDLLEKMDAYWRAANYLSVGQIYLQDNPLLEIPLTKWIASALSAVLLALWRPKSRRAGNPWVDP